MLCGRSKNALVFLSRGFEPPGGRAKVVWRFYYRHAGSYWASWGVSLRGCGVLGVTAWREGGISRRMELLLGEIEVYMSPSGVSSAYAYHHGCTDCSSLYYPLISEICSLTHQRELGDWGPRPGLRLPDRLPLAEGGQLRRDEALEEKSSRAGGLPSGYSAQRQRSHPHSHMRVTEFA